MKKHIREGVAGAAGSVSGAASVLGSWNVCHNVCLGIIAALGVIGITLTGMPLLFLTKIAVPMWSLALIMFLVILGFYIRKRCISKNLLILNSGFLIAGIPFQQLQKFSAVFLSIGGLLILASVLLFVKDRIKRKKEVCEHHA